MAETRVSSGTEANDLVLLAKAHASAGLGLWRDLFRAGLFALEDVAGDVLRQELTYDAPQDWLSLIVRGLMTYYTEAATAIPRAIDSLSRSIDGDRADDARPFGPHHGSRGRHETRVIDGVPVVLPVRIVDASQALAFYFVSASQAQQYLAAQARQFSVVDVGRGRTPLAIFGVEYRESDLGTYTEIGVGLFVRPQQFRSEIPGTWFVSLTVNDEFNLIRATPLWGYTKTLAQHMQLTYSPDRARFAIDGADPGAFAITFPQFGRNRSTDVPCYTWGLGKENCAPYKTLIQRSATGEGIQVAGNVELQLGDGTQARCICRLGPGRDQLCVCLMLRDLGLPKRPVANIWSEHMSALCAEAVILSDAAELG